MATELPTLPGALGAPRSTLFRVGTTGRTLGHADVAPVTSSLFSMTATLLLALQSSCRGASSTSPAAAALSEDSRVANAAVSACWPPPSTRLGAPCSLSESCLVIAQSLPSSFQHLLQTPNLLLCSGQSQSPWFSLSLANGHDTVPPAEGSNMSMWSLTLTPALSSLWRRPLAPPDRAFQLSRPPCSVREGPLP